MILEQGEVIERAASGYYDDGYAVVLATNRRVLFLDKKLMSFRAEDLHYEMISEVEHYLGPMVAVLRVHGLSKPIVLKSLHHSNIQAFAIHVEQKSSDIRFNMQNVQTWANLMERAQSQQQPQMPARNPISQQVFTRNQ